VSASVSAPVPAARQIRISRHLLAESSVAVPHEHLHARLSDHQHGAMMYRNMPTCKCTWPHSSEQAVQRFKDNVTGNVPRAVGGRGRKPPPQAGGPSAISNLTSAQVCGAWFSASMPCYDCANVFF